MRYAYRTQANAQAIAAIYNKPLDKPEWFKVIAAKNADEESEILLFDYIGWPYNDPREFVQALSGLGDVTIRINSPGGDTFDGAAIYNSITSHKGNVTTRIEGLAASMASVIAVAGKKVQAYDNTMFMAHNAWTFTMGNQYELRDMADLLEKVDGTILDAYQKKTKMGKKEIAQIMKDTTWMTAKEAKDKGFIDEIVTGKSVKANFNLSIFANAPDDISDDPQGRELTRKETERALRNAGASREYARALAAKRADASEVEDPPVVVPPIIVPPQIIDNSSLIAAIKNNINLLGGN
jgi:ATP-dependent Clp protease protease subunit